MDLAMILLLAGMVWAVFVVLALALCRAASRADAQAEDRYAGEVARSGDLARAENRWRAAAL
jgi:hypothetical protein